MQYLLGIIGILATAVGYLFVKKQSAEALNQNVDTKEKVQDLEADRLKNQSQEELEALKRDLLKQNSDKDKNSPIKPGDFN